VIYVEGIFLTDICFTTQDRSQSSSVIPSVGEESAELINHGSPNSLAMTIAKQLDSYFAGTLKKFDLPIKLTGTAFQKSVWKALGQIPYGQTRSYSEIAKMIKNPKAVRAVGTAIGNNPIGLILPCHRVIRSDGKIGEFAWGVKIKKQLLKLESAI